MFISELTSTPVTGAPMGGEGTGVAVRLIRASANASTDSGTQLPCSCGFEAGPFLVSLGLSPKTADDLQSCSRSGLDPYCPSPGGP